MKKLIASLAMMCIVLMAGAVEYKNVSVLGDSYSTFKGYVYPDTNAVWYAAPAIRNTDVSSVEETWWRIFTEETGVPIEVNNSFSGATICNTGYKKKDYSDRSFITRMDNLGNPELILVFGATNDCWAGSPLEGRDSTDLYAVRPAMHCLFSGLARLYPKADVVFMLNDEIQGDIRKIILDTCELYNVPCLELTDVDKKSGHPSVEGMRQISDQLVRFLDRMQADNSSGE